MSRVREFGEVLTKEESRLPWNPESISSYIQTKQKYFPNFIGEPKRLTHRDEVAWYLCFDLGGFDEQE